MLINLREYHRPGPPPGAGEFLGLDETLALLARSDIRTVVLAGGDSLLASADPTIEAVVDLQDLGLDALEMGGEAGDILGIGAMVSRASLADSEIGQSLWGGILSTSTRSYGSNIRRNRGTVGGAVALADAADPLLAALLAVDSVVRIHTPHGAEALPLADFLARRSALLAAPALITGIEVPSPTMSSSAAIASVARTPADLPIIFAVVCLQWELDVCRGARVAMGCVASQPVRLLPIEAELSGRTLTEAGVAELAPKARDLVWPEDDLRASAGYRREMAAVVTERALLEALTHRPQA